jgi:hypothetical protein
MIKYQYKKESVLLKVLDLAITAQWGKTCQIVLLYIKGCKIYYLLHFEFDKLVS